MAACTVLVLRTPSMQSECTSCVLNHVALDCRRLCRRLAPRAEHKRRRGPARALRRLGQRVLPCAEALQRVAARAGSKRGMRQWLRRAVGAPSHVDLVCYNLTNYLWRVSGGETVSRAETNSDARKGAGRAEAA